MEEFHVKGSEALCLGVSLAASGLLYYLYKKNKTTLDKLDVGLDCIQKKPIFTKSYIYLFFYNDSGKLTFWTSLVK